MAQPIYTNVPRQLSDVLKDVRSGRIGLPDLQRPFVWPDSKVRDLYDSMLKGFPIGYIMLWESPLGYDDKKSSIGKNDKTYTAPKDLVIDGQQRLTALVASMYGVEVKDKNFRNRRIRISYKPLTKEFAVWTKATDNDAEYIADISHVFLAKETNTSPKFRREFIKRLNESREKFQREQLTDDDEAKIEESLNELLSLESYQIPSLEITHSSNEEDVADIFVRVNSAGQKLTENDFILTLISVYDKSQRDKIDQFCEDSRYPSRKTSYTGLLNVEPANIIRMAVGVGFRRARLRYAYMILRGKDLQTGVVSDDIRNRNLGIFDDALMKVINLDNWHAFFNVIREAGYLSERIIASTNAIVYTYVLYLIAKYDYKMEPMRLKRMIRRWFFMTAVTYYYTGSSESTVEKQFTDMRALKDANALESYIDTIIEGTFTSDYFRITLPMELITSSAISPSWYGYVAAQIVLGYPLLFSTTPLSSMFALGSSGNKNALDRHHIFPKAYLEKIGIIQDRDRNQTANMTYLDYTQNITISDKAPAVYIHEFRVKVGEDEYRKFCGQHALPIDFETMDYFDFLQQRRILMAQIVKDAFDRLSQ